MNTNETMEERFDRSFGEQMQLVKYQYQTTTGGWIYQLDSLIKSFIRFEVDKAVALREQEIVEIVKNMPTATRDECENEKVICSDGLIATITKKD